MKKWLLLLLCCCLALPGALGEAPAETNIILSDDQIWINGNPIGESTEDIVYLAYQTETHPDVGEGLQGIANRVITITGAGVYRISGTAMDAQIAVKAGEADRVRLILDGMDITCRTAPGIIIHSAFDPRTPGEYGVTIELAAGSTNKVTGSHTARILDTDVKFDGAVDSLVSLGFEGEGRLTVDADNEGMEVKYGHMTINGGVFDIQAGDDPLNVSEDGVGVLTVNGGNLYSAVKPLPGGEGDGIDSNGYIIFNGGTVINLAHPTSQDGGIDSDMGSVINGGVIVGAGNMYDPIEADSAQLFMMLEFTEATSDLVVVTDQQGKAVFAYDFPYDYKYIAFSTPELQEGVYHVYLGGEIEGEAENGLYTRIDSYVPGRQMTHGGASAQQGMNKGGFGFGFGFGFGGGQPQEAPEGMEAPPEIPEGTQWPEGMEAPPEIPEGTQLPEGMEAPPEIPEGAQWPEGMETPPEIPDWMQGRDGVNGFDPGARERRNDWGKGWNGDRGGMNGGFGGGFGGPRGMESSAAVATGDFYLSKDNTGFTNLTAIQ